MVTAKNIIPSKFAEKAITTQYTVPSKMMTVIDKFTVTLVIAGPVTLQIWLVSSGGAAATSNLIVNRNLVTGECYQCSELVGHVLGASGFIVTNAGALNALVIRASGREIT